MRADGRVGAAAHSALSVARSFDALTWVEPSRVVRRIEDAVLTELAPRLQRAVRGVDSTYDREMQELQRELRRRENEYPEHPGGASRESLDGFGFVLAAVGFGIAMAARTGSAIDPGAAVWIVVPLLVVATLMHLANTIRTRHEPVGWGAAGYRGLTAAAGCISVVLFATWSDLSGATFALVVLVVASATCAVLSIVAAVRIRRLAQKIADYETEVARQRADLDSSATVCVETARAAVRELLAGLDDQVRAEIEWSWQAGIEAAREAEALDRRGHSWALGLGVLESRYPDAL